jgi:hypothetical protein
VRMPVSSAGSLPGRRSVLFLEGSLVHGR